MAVVIAVILTVVASIVYDHICCWRRIGNFEAKASEFLNMYETLGPKVLQEEANEPEGKEFIFEGETFLMTVQKGDSNSFYSQLELAICEVFDSYDRIGAGYLDRIDKETEARIEELYGSVEKVNNDIRYNMWLKKK